MSSRGIGQSHLTESVDSKQAALNLGATAKYVSLTWFLTFTCNQAMHPGISHLCEFKESREWVKNISSSFFNYYETSSDEKN